MARRQYSNTATEATLTGGIGSGETSFTLSSFAGYPSAPFTATIARGEVDEEVVLVTAVSVSTVTVTRGYDGTAAKAHAAGASFIHTAVAKDFDEANAHVVITTGAHGVVGALVGTSDTQTLSNKTLVAPAITAPTITGAASLASGTVSGTWAVTGATTLASVTATTGTFSGNTTVGGTLGVTGVTTLGAVTVTGAATMAAVSGTTGAFTGNVTVGGTLGVTGKATFATAAVTAAPSAATDIVNKAHADTLVRPVMYVQSAAPTGTIPEGAIWFQVT